MNEDLRATVAAASNRQDVLAAVGRVYDEVDARVATRRPVCTASGKCCKFEAYGHRLYVSTLELAAFVASLNARSASMAVSESGASETAAAWDGTGCPFQRDGLCTAHAIRPFGCRMYFCDPTSTAWQNDAYARFHASLKRLHDELNVPYFYVEWRAALAALGLSPPLVHRPHAAQSLVVVQVERGTVVPPVLGASNTGGTPVPR